jgi:toxin ParE1/3/4
MVKVVWSSRAVDDLRNIKRFISRDKPAAAALFGKRIFELTRRLKFFPLLGRVVPEKEDDSLRELIYGSYRILYHVSDESVEIIHVHHSAQLFPLD